MQTLGLSDSTPRTESRLKSLFWPSVQSAADVDYLGTQGFWVCTVLAVFTFLVSSASSFPISGFFFFLLYFLGGVGARERSWQAAGVVFLLSLLDTLSAGISVVRILFTALLFSNLRAIWIASRWKPESEEATLPPRLGETWTDKLSDRLPLWLWPKIRIVYYIFAVCMLIMTTVGLAVIAAGGVR
jgi:hypothetical protein